MVPHVRQLWLDGDMHRRENLKRIIGMFSSMIVRDMEIRLSRSKAGTLFSERGYGIKKSKHTYTAERSFV